MEKQRCTVLSASDEAENPVETILIAILTKPKKSIRVFSIKMSSSSKNRQVRMFDGFLLRFSLLLYNLDSDYVLK